MRRVVTKALEHSVAVSLLQLQPDVVNPRDGMLQLWCLFGCANSSFYRRHILHRFDDVCECLHKLPVAHHYDCDKHTTLFLGRRSDRQGLMLCAS